ncbi:unnamed protein product, partial [Strongylus vulgaris]
MLLEKIPFQCLALNGPVKTDQVETATMISLSCMKTLGKLDFLNMKPPKPVNVRPWAQLNVMEQSYVAKLASLLKVSEVDISRKDWFEEICGKVEKTIYHLDLDISTLKGSKARYKKRVEQARLLRQQLKLLSAKRQ